MLQRAFLLALLLPCVCAFFWSEKEAPPPEESYEWPPAGVLLTRLLSWLAQGTVVSSLTACASVVALSPQRTGLFLHEAWGSVVMILGTCSPGPFLGGFAGYEAAAAFVTAIVFCDFMTGGPNVNPVCSTALLLWTQGEYAELLVKIAGQVAGGIVGFPLLSVICGVYGKQAGGPAWEDGLSMREAVLSEFCASFLLVSTIGVIGRTRVGSYYWFKQPLVGVLIRTICNTFGQTGPAMNPMLASTWIFTSTGAWPTDWQHYVVFWTTPLWAGVTAARLIEIVLPEQPKQQTDTEKALCQLEHDVDDWAAGKPPPSEELTRIASLAAKAKAAGLSHVKQE